MMLRTCERAAKPANASRKTLLLDTPAMMSSLRVSRRSYSTGEASSYSPANAPRADSESAGELGGDIRGAEACPSARSAGRPGLQTALAGEDLEPERLGLREPERGYLRLGLLSTASGLDAQRHHAERPLDDLGAVVDRVDAPEGYVRLLLEDEAVVDVQLGLGQLPREVLVGDERETRQHGNHQERDCCECRQALRRGERRRCAGAWRVRRRAVRSRSA